MSSRLLIARLLWIFPLLLLVLTIYLVQAAFDIRQTLMEGETVRAEVLEIFNTDRVDVTYAYIRLRLPLNGEMVERRLPMPLSFINFLKGRDSVNVRVRPGADQEVVLLDVARPQWRMAAINAAISFLGLVLLSIGVFAWNRYLRRQGDPGERTVSGK